MQNVVNNLTRVVVALVAITGFGFECAAYDFEDLTYEGSVDTMAFGCNSQGLVVGGANFEDGLSVGWVFDPKEQTFTELPPLPGCELVAWGITNSGVIAGSCYTSPNSEEGFILKHGIYTSFAYPGFDYTEPRAISSTGIVTGYAQDSTGTCVGFIYDPKRGTFTDITFPEMYGWFTAQGINANGRVVGSVWLEFGYAYEGSPQGQYGFVREPSGAITLFRVHGSHTAARGINDAGDIVGFIHNDGGPYLGFVGTLTSLGGFQAMTNAELIMVPFAGATDTFTVAIDNTGRIVGSWWDESGDYHGFIATPVRKPDK